jgi:hypothetical protein
VHSDKWLNLSHPRLDLVADVAGLTANVFDDVRGLGRLLVTGNPVDLEGTQEFLRERCQSRIEGGYARTMICVSASDL